MRKSTHDCNLDMEVEEDQFTLLRAIARSETVRPAGTPVRNFFPILKHPLPPSERRLRHLDNLRYVMSCKLDTQAVAAIAKGNICSGYSINFHFQETLGL